MRLWLLIFLLIIVGLIGGCLTKLINKGVVPAWAAVMPSVLSGILWGFMAKQQTTLSLSFLSMIYDVTYAASFVAVFVMMGDRLSFIQACGFAVSLLGVVMMSR